MAADERVQLRYLQIFIYIMEWAVEWSQEGGGIKKQDQTKVTSVHASTSSPDSPHSAW